jgi:hypothetical protein
MTAMNRRTLLRSVPALLLLGKTAAARRQDPLPGSTPKSPAVYELRVYHTYPGKLDELQTRFRDHTMRIFEKHGIKNVAYWTPTDDPLKGNALFYIISHSSREAATANWKAFGEDPEWISVRDKSEANGKLVEKVDSTFMALTDFSPAP